MRSHLTGQNIADTSRQPGNRRSAGRPRRAVVLGGSLAGLLTACVLADHVDEVVVVDRDDLSAELTAPRRGVPQARHTHGLLVSGAQALERLLPGLTQSLQARGALRADVLGRSRWLMGGNVLSSVDSGLVGMLASRTLIEAEVRRRVTATPEVSLLGGYDVAGLLAGPDRSRVVGAIVVPRDGGSRLELTADLVVDATGRGSRAPVWLEQLGYEAPPEERVEAQIAYVTRLFEGRQGVLDDLDADIVGSVPGSLASGVALRQEGGRWTVTLAGARGEQPPADLEGFAAYARTLPTPGIAEIATNCRPVGEPEGFRYPASQWRHWEKLDRRPLGFVVLGDAVCSFNPVYGQGMSSAALQVEALRDLLAAGGGRASDAVLDALPLESARALARVAATPWALATGSDRRMPGMPAKPLPERLLDRYLDRLLAVAAGDAAVTVAFGRVLNLLAAPPSLLAPRVAWRVLGPRSWAAVRRSRPGQSAGGVAGAPAATAAGAGKASFADL